MDADARTWYNNRAEVNEMKDGRMNGRAKEIIRFAVTGGLCFLIELGALIALRDGAGLDTLAATPIAFLISVAVNYLICVRWVFPGAADSGKAKAGFLISSVIGLGLNWALMYLFRIAWGEDWTLLSLAGFQVTGYMMNKTIATLLVMIFNYFAKRWILRGKPADQ